MPTVGLVGRSPKRGEKCKKAKSAVAPTARSLNRLQEQLELRHRNCSLIRAKQLFKLLIERNQHEEDKRQRDIVQKAAQDAQI